MPCSASIKTQQFLQPEPAALLCPLLPLTSLHSKPEVDDGGGSQCHVIIISTDLGQELRRPWESSSWLGNHSPHLDKVRSGQPPGGAAGVGGDHVCKGQQGRVYSKHSGLLSAGEVGTPSCLASPGLISWIMPQSRLRGSDAEMGI